MDGHENDADALNQAGAAPSAPVLTPESPTVETPTVSSPSVDATITSDATGGGIFSTSDTRIETENLPDVQPTPLSTAPNGAITPTLRTESTVTGDLKLGGTTKRKKWLVITTGLLALAIVGVGVWYFAGNSNLFTSEEKTAYGVTDESKRLFNRYVNFLINDEDSTGKPELANFLANDYTLLRPEAMFAEQIKLDGDFETARAYFNDLNSMYSEFSQAFFPPENDTAETTEDYSRSAIPNYFFEAAKGSYLNLNQVISLYLQEGEESTRNMLANILSSESDNNDVKALLEARKKQVNLYVDALVQAEQAGCITNGTLDLSCARPKFAAVDAEALKLTTSINELEIKLRKEAITTLEDIYYAFYPEEMIIESAEVK